MENKERYTINAALSTSLPLSGVGDECIIDIVSGEVIARFYNGNFITASSSVKDPSVQQNEGNFVTSVAPRAMEGPTLILEAA